MAKTVILSLTRKQSQVRLDVVQYTTAPDIVFVIEDYTPTGRADFYIEKPSGEEIYNHCTIDGNKVIFTPTTQCFAEVGEQKAQLQILDGDKMAVSFPIQLVVAENIIDSSAAESQSEFTELQAAISTIGQYDQRIQDVQDDMAALETQLTDDMAALQTNVTQQLNDAIAGVNTQIGNVNTELDALENRVGSLEDYGFIYRRQLTSADDLNNITTPGVYWYPTESVPQNAPFENAAVVEVFYAGSTTNRVIQRATRWAVRGQSKFRSLYGGNWINWEQYATATEIASLNAALTNLDNVAAKIANNSVDYPNVAFRVKQLDSLTDIYADGDIKTGGYLEVRENAMFRNAAGVGEVPSITSVDIAAKLPALGGGNFNGSTSIEDKSVASGSIDNLGYIDLPRGTYLLYFFVSWASNATGRRYINLADSPTASSPLYRWLCDSVSAVNGGITTNKIVVPINVTNQTRLFLNALQNSGSALNTQTRWCAVRIDMNI